MFKIISKSLRLLLFSVVVCCIVYPAVIWAIGQTVFPFQANGSMVGADGKPVGVDGKAVGSLLIAQPFSKDWYFQPRPSAISTAYDATSSTSSALAASNYALRYRVAQTIGPLATYKSGSKAGQSATSDIEAWFQKDQFGSQPHIVAQWADAHSSNSGAGALAWVGSTFDPKNPTPQQQYVLDWSKSHKSWKLTDGKWQKGDKTVIDQFKADNTDNTDPSPSDLVVVFFDSFSNENPGKFLSTDTQTDAKTGKSTTTMKVVKDGSDIQSNFFDMWLSENPKVELQDVPGDLVTTSGSGLDPHITLDNALFQLDRVAGAWADRTKLDKDKLHKEIEQLLRDKSSAPFGGSIGEPIVNVLEVNLELNNRYEKSVQPGK